jgi:hypothetical protein
MKLSENIGITFPSCGSGSETRRDEESPHVDLNFHSIVLIDLEKRLLGIY